MIWRASKYLELGDVLVLVCTMWTSPYSRW
jgi:hypothetical protein